VLGGLAAEDHDQVGAVVSHLLSRYSARLFAPWHPIVRRYRAVMRFRASDVAAATDGMLFGPDVDVDGVSFDSRTLRPGELFVALVAERDGHDFIPAALSAGAPAYLTQGAPGSGTAIVVADVAEALMQLGSWGRSHLDAQVIGITGSVGKTSTKDLARAALGAGLRTAANEKSFNNEQGLPVTILNAPNDVEALIVEMGMRGFGEIARLCAIARPTIGVVTRVATAHTERLGGIEGVARAKSELVRALPSNGTAILNADDEHVAAMASVAPCDVITFGHSQDALVRIRDVRLDALARPAFTIDTPWGSGSVSLAVSGGHMATNAAAALAAAGAAGVDLAAAAAALADARLSPWRMEIMRNRAGAVVINDAYNANPVSMRAAIDTLAALPVTGRRMAVLGVMAELVDPEREHAAVAALLTEHGIELIAVGTELYGVAPSDDPLTALASLSGDDALLVKGSRVAGLERLVTLVLGQ
jgi:UDP-N-acetylmuramoyl-tripeptide--D-alanyl-D-alanine ligase